MSNLVSDINPVLQTIELYVLKGQDYSNRVQDNNKSVQNRLIWFVSISTFALSSLFILYGHINLDPSYYFVFSFPWVFSIIFLLICIIK